MLKLTLFWFRRDLRLEDNCGLFYALKESHSVQPLFIFDRHILEQLENPSDPRVHFIHEQLERLKTQLRSLGSDLWVHQGGPEEVFSQLIENNVIEAVYCNHDYEPYARDRDRKVYELLQSKGIAFKTYKDQVIFEKSEVLSDLGKPYTVYTPFKKKWLSQLTPSHTKPFETKALFDRFNQAQKGTQLIRLEDMGFKKQSIVFPPSTGWGGENLKKYSEHRDFPYLDKATSLLGLHLRFGTVSVRAMVQLALGKSDVWLSELIWREFFMQILWHFPHVVRRSFKPQYEKIEWRNKKSEFELWASGMTGYPLVDAGMRELNETGHMHNRVRMVVASFLTKHLLTHWYLGERYFASRLLDYDLSANNGNWQWAAGTGCDAAPYFRVFNPETQIEKFDPEYKYIKKWVKEFGTSSYPKPMVEHKFARNRALETYKKGLDISKETE